MKKLIRSMVSAILVGLLMGPTLTSELFAAASGNYTDLLPVGAAGNTTVISNGSGWSLATLPVTQTFGDALSRVVTTVYQSTATKTITQTTVSTFTALSGGSVGSATFPATWVATGRSIRFTVKGLYKTGAPETGTWTLKIGTTTVMTTGALTINGNQGNSAFSAVATVTVGTTGLAGTAIGAYDIFLTSGPAATGSTAMISYSTATTTAASVDWTSQLTVNPTFAWTTGTSSMTITTCFLEFLN